MTRRALWVGCALLASTGCLTRTPPPRLSEVTPIAVAYVVDDAERGGVSDAPPALKREIASRLAEMNLEARPIPFEQLAQPFQQRRNSQARYQALAELAPQAPYLLLVETRVTFFSQLSGRFRWDVAAKLTAGPRGREPVSAELETAALMQYHHERVPEALEATAAQLADRVRSLVSGFIGSPVAQGPSKGALSDAIYFVMVDRFHNGDTTNDGAVDRDDPAAFHGGDLQGVLDKLDWLQSLGVRTVWLSPIFRMRTEKFFEHGAFHGYWTEDLGQVEPRFGDAALLRKLADALHARGMRLVLDVVLNHVAMDSPLVRKKPQWFHRKGPLEDWNDPIQLVTHDVHGLPDLAQEREEVYAYLKDASLRWLSVAKVDGFRLDAVKHVPLSFWARYNQDVRQAAGEDFLLLGEMLDGDPKLLARVNREGRFGAMFDFPLHFALIDVFCRGQAPLKLGAVLSSDRIYPDPDALVTLIDNHDLPRVMSDCGGDEQRVKDALTFQLTSRGVPSLTYGTEVGLLGKTEPENRADMRFLAAHPLRAHVQRLLSARARHPSLTKGAVKLLAAEEDFFAYARVAADEVTVIAVNQGGSARPVPVPPVLEDALGEELVTGGSLRAGALKAPVKGVLAVTFPAPTPGAFAALEQASREQWREGGRKRRVELTAFGAPLGKGDELFVAGSGPELGQWDASRALGPLDGQGTVRSALPVGTAFEFKLLVQRKDGTRAWEGGENRALFVEDEAGPLALRLQWGKREEGRP